MKLQILRPMVLPSLEYRRSFPDSPAASANDFFCFLFFCCSFVLFFDFHRIWLDPGFISSEHIRYIASPAGVQRVFGTGV